ncbi:PRC-barrel domain-containing protein [Halalkalibacter lacteus]|uniref:PRC-barrel domain-containing protein n=1 Tax=Halalkalibacter lacteus TaxID=3090663 RepID=UPI002FC955C8
MYLKSSNLQTFSLLSKDGELGSIDDFYFEASNLMIRYFAINTRKWFFGGTGLLSPKAFAAINIPEQMIEVTITKEQLKNSPKLSDHSPLSLAYEKKLNHYYGWSLYWKDQIAPPIEGENLSGSPMNGVFTSADDQQELVQLNQTHHVLRTSSELIGCKVYAKNKEVGKITDLVIDHQSWDIRFLEIDIGGFLSKQVVPLSTNWISEINWIDGVVLMNKDKQEVEQTLSFEGSYLYEGDFRSHVEAGHPPDKEESSKKK